MIAVRYLACIEKFLVIDLMMELPSNLVSKCNFLSVMVISIPASLTTTLGRAC